MFYPIDLLSRRRRGKLAPSWLAAMTSEKLFKRNYNSGTIKKIDVVQTCNEILEVIQPCNGRSERYSLYLSSQLIYGVTRIFSYQTAYCYKEMFEINRILEKKKNANDFDEIEIPAIAETLPDDNFLDFQLGPDMNLFHEDIDARRLQLAMQDAAYLDPNFGCLNDEELAYMLEHDDNTSLGPILRKLQLSREEDILERDISEKMADISIAEEAQQEKRSSQEEVHPIPVLVDISKRKDKSTERLSLTPQKRAPKPPEMQEMPETPTKRRRLVFEDAAMMTVPPAPVEEAAAPVFELPAEETRTLALPQQMESLDSSDFVVPINRRLKKRKIIDEKTSLTDEQLCKWRQDLNVHCRKVVIAPIRRSTPMNLFKQSSHLSKRWNASLRKLFVDRTTGPFTSVDEGIAPAELVQFQEPMRVEETYLHTEGLSAFGKTDTVIVADPDTITLPMTNVIHETVDEPMDVDEPLPEAVVPDAIILALEEGTSIVEHRRDEEKTTITNIDESFEDIEILLERQRQECQASKEILESSATSIVTSPPALTSREILALLEVLWSDQPRVEFSQLVPEDTYTRDDAATVFKILLEFHAQKKLVLQQTECFSTLWILKKHL